MNSSNEKEISATKKRRERDKHNRKKEIIKAAELLFLRKGYENTSMEEIANEALYSKGTLYNYFESKDDLFLAIGSNVYSLMIEYTEDFISKEKPGINQIRAIGYAFYEFTKKYPDYNQVLHDLSSKIPDITNKSKNKLTPNENEFLNLGDSYWALFLKVINDAKSINVIRDDISPMMIAIALSSLTSGLINELEHWQKPFIEHGFNGDQIVDFIFDIVCEGLKPRE